MRSALRSAAGIGMCLFLVSCGYTQKTRLPRDIKTIHVDTVVNRLNIADVYAYEPGLEMRITNAVIDRLQKDGNLRVVDRDSADAVLEASLVKFEQQGLRFDSLERVEEFRVVIVLDLVLKDNRTKDVIWEEPSFSGDAEYYVGTVRSISRGEAADRAIQRLARNVVDRIVEDW